MRTLFSVFLLVAAASAFPAERRDLEDWMGAALISENDLKNVDPAEVKEAAENLREDMDHIGKDLDELLEKGVKSEAAGRVAEHLKNSVLLAELHEKHGANSIPPEPVEIPEGCKPEDFGKDCKENFKRVVGCLKKAVDGMKATFDDSETTVVQKIKKVKGIVGLVAKATGPIDELRKACSKEFEKKREYEDWAMAALVGKDDLKDMDPAEIEEVGQNLRKDLDGIGNDLDALLDEGIDGPAAKRVEEHLENSVKLAQLHEKMGADSIPPNDDIKTPVGCRKEDFGTDCEENFKRVVGCLKKAVNGIKEIMDSDAEVDKKISSVKGVVGLVAKATGPIKELHDACKPKRSLFRFFQ